MARAEDGFCSSLFWISDFCKALSTVLFSHASVSSSCSASVPKEADPEFQMKKKPRT